MPLLSPKSCGRGGAGSGHATPCALHAERGKHQYSCVAPLAACGAPAWCWCWCWVVPSSTMLCPVNAVLFVVWAVFMGVTPPDMGCMGSCPTPEPRRFARGGGGKDFAQVCMKTAAAPASRVKAGRHAAHANYRLKGTSMTVMTASTLLPQLLPQQPTCAACARNRRNCGQHALHAQGFAKVQPTHAACARSRSP